MPISFRRCYFRILESTSVFAEQDAQKYKMKKHGKWKHGMWKHGRRIIDIWTIIFLFFFRLPVLLVSKSCNPTNKKA
jgi:hypothetical protein